MSSFDLQLGSPLYSVLPTEVRLEIYACALTPTDFDGGWHSPWLSKHDFRVRHNHDSDPRDGDWEAATKYAELEQRGMEPGAFNCSFRPDLKGRPVLSPTLLLTCRRVLGEARHLLFQNERCFRTGLDHVRFRCFSADSHPPWYIDETMDGKIHEWPPERKIWERQFTKIRLVGPVENLNEAMHAEQHLLRDVEHLRITIRFTDWMLPRHSTYVASGFELQPPVINALGYPPHIIAHLDPPQHVYMWDMMEVTKDFNSSGAAPGHAAPVLTSGTVAANSCPSWKPPFAKFLPGQWAREFVNMPRLKSLTMDFDIDEDRREKLPEIVEWVVRTWHLPLNPNHAGYHYLSAEGNPVRQMSWRGTIHDWPFRCPECNEYLGIRYRLPFDSWKDWNCKRHSLVWAMFLKGCGPRIYSWSVTWTPRRYGGPETYPYEGSDWFGVAKHDIPDSSMPHEEDKDRIWAEEQL